MQLDKAKFDLNKIMGHYDISNTLKTYAELFLENKSSIDILLIKETVVITYEFVRQKKIY